LSEPPASAGGQNHGESKVKNQKAKSEPEEFPGSSFALYPLSLRLSPFAKTSMFVPFHAQWNKWNKMEQKSALLHVLAKLGLALWQCGRACPLAELGLALWQCGRAVPDRPAAY